MKQLRVKFAYNYFYDIIIIKNAGGERYVYVDDEKFLKKIGKNILRYRFGAVLCCFLHQMTFLIPIILTIVAAVYVATQEKDAINAWFLLGLSLAGTALSTTGTLCNFRKLWHINRDAVYELRIIQVKIEDTDYRNNGQHRVDFQKVIREHQSNWRSVT